MGSLGLRSAALAIACAALALGPAACGGGETTVTVTETVASAPAEGGGGGEKTSPEDGEEGGAVTGYVDNVASNSEAIALSGWAGSADLTEPASRVTVLVGGKEIGGAVPAVKREDVVEALGKPGLLESGFELTVPRSVLECGAPAAGIEVIGSLGKKESVLLFGEGIKGRIEAEC